MPGAGVGRVAGTVGTASMMRDEYVARARTNDELKLAWLKRLEERSKRGWKWALKDAFQGKDCVGFEGFVRATGGLYSQEEGMRLYELWEANGQVERHDVEKDLTAMERGDTALFANYNKGASLDPVISAGSKSRSNLESADSSLVPIEDGPYAASPTQRMPATVRPITAATSKPPPVDRSAGVAMVTGGTLNNGSSVPGGIFSADFLNAPFEKPGVSGKSNLPSIAGGIFEDHSDDVPQPNPNPSRSQISSVPGGIFAPSARAATVEYGYERFPRQGLPTVSGSNEQRLI